MTNTITTQTGRIGNGTAIHAFRVRVSDRGTLITDLCGSSFRNNGRPQRNRLVGTDLAEVTCTKCIKALAA
jgi:hypothetical protein